MNTSRSSASGRYFLLLLLLPLGCLLVQDGEADPVIAAPQPLPVFNPPLGPGTTPVETITVEAEGGMLTLSSGTRITVPAQAFVDTAGQAVTEPVTLTVREFHNPIETWLAGIPMYADGDAVFRSAGMMELRGATPDGREVELANDKVLQLDWYSVEDDEGYVTWALDTASGVWSETGTANSLETRDLETELAEAEADLPPRTNPVPPNRHTFDIGDQTGRQPELKRYEGVRFVPVDGRPCGHDATRIEVDPITDGSGGAFLIRFIVDTVLQMQFQAGSNDPRTYTAPFPIDSVTECRCDVALPPGATEREAARIQRLLNGDSDRKRERGRRAAMALWEEYNATIERQYLTNLLRPSGLENRPDRPGRIVARSMQIDRMGYVNCDIVIPYPDEVDLLVDLIGPDGGPLDVQNLAVMDIDTRTLYPCEGGRIRLDPARRNVVFGYANGQLAYLTKAQVDGLRNSVLPVPIAPELAALGDLDNPASTIATLILGS
jgi:hypothetical protein